MIRTIFMCLSAPFVSVLSGKHKGHKVTRNPFAWAGLFLWGLVLIPFTIVVYPILMIWTYLGFNRISKYGLSGHFENDSLIVKSEQRGVEAAYSVEDIDCVLCKFNPPLIYPVLLLTSGERVELQMADSVVLFQECKEYGIRVNETPSMDA